VRPVDFGPNRIASNGCELTLARLPSRAETSLRLQPGPERIDGGGLAHPLLSGQQLVDGARQGSRHGRRGCAEAQHHGQGPLVDDVQEIGQRAPVASTSRDNSKHPAKVKRRLRRDAGGATPAPDRSGRGRDPSRPQLRWRKKVFSIMARNARSATQYFGIPPNRVVELGAQIEF
jgi:hypothetical protein